MNGPAHYKEAERLLVQSDEVAARTSEGAHALAAQAQAHATLALAASVVDTAMRENIDPLWFRAVG